MVSWVSSVFSSCCSRRRKQSCVGNNKNDLLHRVAGKVFVGGKPFNDETQGDFDRPFSPKDRSCCSRVMAAFGVSYGIEESKPK